MSQLKKLINKRETVKSKITIFDKFISKVETTYVDKRITEQNILIELEQRLQRFQNLIDEYEEIQLQIDETADKPEEQFKERETFETDFFACVARAKSFLVVRDEENKVTNSNNGDLANNDSNVIQSVKLPVIQLPRFDGNSDSWLEYRDTFDSLIHQNLSITNIQKFHYLRASLAGSPLQIIASLEFSSSNYTVAWDLVCDRFNNTRILKQNHVKALFNLERLFEESSISLRKMIDSVNKHLRALKLLKEPTESWDTLVIHLITTKLDSVTAREWEQKRSAYDNPSLDNLKEFLKNRADLLEALEQNKTGKKYSKIKHEAKTKTFLTARVYCIFCKNEHYIQDCQDFLKLTVLDRIDQAKRLRLCINCLRPGHMIKQCRSSSCKKCNSRHNTLLHIEKNDAPAQLDKNNVDQQESVNLSSRNSNNTQVLLSTVLINIFDSNNKLHTARALLDSASQSSFMTIDFARTLNLQRHQTNIKVSGINQTHSEIKYRVLAQMQSKINNFVTNVNCLVVPQISNDLPNFKINATVLKIPTNITLADPKFYIPDKIDILLGADIFWQIMCVGQIKLENGPILQKSRLGWIIAGPLHSTPCESIQCNFSELDKQITRFWEVEELSMKKPLSQDEVFCESHFLETVRRDKSGRFIVTIPMKDSPTKLGDSYDNAKNRFLSLERKLNNNSDLKEQYFKFIDDYRNLGHMFKVPENDNAQYSYYLPHHGVIKQSSLTTKLRVVFDASCPTTTGVSLNDLQMVGSVLQSDLFSLLVRHRKYNYVIAGDIEKMYRMCLVNPEQTPLQRILWRDEPNGSIDIYELATVTYGTAAAAHLAIRCLYQLGIDCASESKLISDVIQNHFYVDDLLSGGDTIEEVIFIANEVARVLKAGGFSLRKWASNSPEVLRGIANQENAEAIDFGVNENTKTLGIIWNSKTDSFMYNINSNFSKLISKRSILSEMSQIFDPLGLLSPCIIIAKIIMQQLWLEKISWDESLPHHLHTRWLQFRDELKYLDELKIERQVICKNPSLIEMHGFSDASAVAIGACIYIRSENEDGQRFVQIVCAKSKVAPLKTQTIPRLELMASLLLAQLGNKIKLALGINMERIVYWCDSSIVLSWLKMSPSNLQAFVANRVASIQELSDGIEWRYVPSAENPADHISRGVRPSMLHSLNIYWYGPEWLQDSKVAWPSLRNFEENLPEIKKVVHSHNTAIEMSFTIFERFSCLTKLERAIAYCRRFWINCHKIRDNRNIGPLTSQEIQEASLCLVKLSQHEYFSDEFKLLKTNKLLNSKCQITKLNPFLDNDNVIRVGGRLSNSNFNFAKKHPILLSSKSCFTKLLFVREHKRLLHAGPQLLLSSIRDKFWPLSGRNLARLIVHDCIVCFRAKPRLIAPIMGNLPAQRLNPAPPFYTTGVDYAGPFLIKDKEGRGYKLKKCYISLFVCFLTRAVHLEVVSDLTTESFIAALRRFISRRGKPHQMFSDNGKNFVSANTELQKFGRFLWDKAHELTNNVESEGISWSFIPVNSPHFGGLWEAGVKSAKHHLHRVAGNARLGLEQFYTLLVQIEAMLNSRPMSPLSSDPSDYTPLTPAHFLIGRPLVQAADPDVTHITENRLSHFQRVQQLQQHFWSRWSREYVSELQQRCKWRTQHGSLQLNDLVLIKDDNLPPLKWMLGRVINLHPGADGVARVATVRTSTGNIKRAFSKICPLPVQ